MPDQAPNIDIKPGEGGRLVYDKERQTIVAQPNPIERAKREIMQRHAKRVIDFLNRIEGDGFGGTTEYEIALAAAKDLGAALQQFCPDAEMGDR